MSVKRTTYRRGAFEHTAIEGHFSKDEAPEERKATEDAMKETLRAASPRSRVKEWKAHAERLRIELYALREAETLIDEKGHVTEMDRFDLCMSRAAHAMDLVMIEQTIMPAAIMGAPFTDKRVKGFADKVSRRREIMETLAKTLILNDPRLEVPELAAKITSNPMAFKYQGLKYSVYRVTEPEKRSHKRGYTLYFKCGNEEFNRSMHTFVGKLRNAKKLQ